MKMKVNALLSLILLACLPFSGCKAKEAPGQAQDDLKPAAASVVPELPEELSGRDYTVPLGDLKVDLEGKAIQPVLSSCYKGDVCETVAELNEASTEIVRGVITAVEYFSMYGTAYTKIDFQIDEVLKGDKKRGDSISAYKMGGYMLLKDAMPDLQERSPEVTDETMRNTVVDEKPNGDPHPQVGQECVLFLQPGLLEGDLQDIFLITGGWEGQYVVLRDGRLSRYMEGSYDLFSGAVQTFGAEDSEQPYTGEREDLDAPSADRIFGGLDELKSEITAALTE